jgi:DNA-directed RNA polymerase specialized sigma24 family protein
MIGDELGYPCWMAENSPLQDELAAAARFLDEADAEYNRALGTLFNSPIGSGQRIAWINRRVAELQGTLTPELIGCASKWVGRDSAEDVVADVWTELLRSLSDHDKRAESLFSCLPRESAIRPFLFKAAHFRAMDVLRKRNRPVPSPPPPPENFRREPPTFRGWEDVLLLIQDPSSTSNWRSSLAIHQFVVFFRVTASGMRQIDIVRDLSSTLGQLLEMPSDQNDAGPHAALLIERIRSALRRRMLTEYREGVLWRDVRIRELLDRDREARTHRRKTPEDDYAKIISDWIFSINRRIRQRKPNPPPGPEREHARRERCLYHLMERSREEEATAPGLLGLALIMVARYKPFEGHSSIRKVLDAVSELSMEEAFSILKNDTGGSFPNFFWSDSLETYFRSGGSEPVWKSSMRALASNVDARVEPQPKRFQAGLTRMSDENRKISPGTQAMDPQSIVLWALIMAVSGENFERFWSVPGAVESVGELDHGTAMSSVNQYIASNYRNFDWPNTIRVEALIRSSETIRAASVRTVFEREHNVFRGRDLRKYGGQSK